VWTFESLAAKKRLAKRSKSSDKDVTPPPLWSINTNRRNSMREVESKGSS